jgi:predicted AAA+ superfamily ATPase
MYQRLLQAPATSFFLFGPRGTGKSTWVRDQWGTSVYIDLLAASNYLPLQADPQRLVERLPADPGIWIILDEIQRAPRLLDEVHRLIETTKLRFILTGSSARTLRRRGTNLLAGRALTCSMHPLVFEEMGAEANLTQALRYGMLPGVIHHADPMAFLQTYVHTYVREEVQQEAMVKDLAAFVRFLEAAALSVGGPLNVSALASDCSVDRKTTEQYLQILEDLMLAQRLPVFTKKAKRTMLQRQKLLFFDAGVFRAMRPKGPLDDTGGLDGFVLETLIYQQLRAINSNCKLDYQLFYWHTANHQEVDFVLYGPRGLVAIEVKLSNRVRSEDLSGLRAFYADYPMAKTWLVCNAPNRQTLHGHVEVMPIDSFLRQLSTLL